MHLSETMVINPLPKYEGHATTNLQSSCRKQMVVHCVVLRLSYGATSQQLKQGETRTPKGSRSKSTL